jgi:hypothetical protein
LFREFVGMLQTALRGKIEPGADSVHEREGFHSKREASDVQEFAPVDGERENACRQARAHVRLGNVDHLRAVPTPEVDGAVVGEDIDEDRLGFVPELAGAFVLVQIEEEREVGSGAGGGGRSW